MEDFEKIVDEDDGIPYDVLNKFLVDDTNRNKNRFVNEIEESGSFYLREIERKKKIHKSLKIKYIEYILKHNDLYTEEELLGYEVADVIQIYEELKIKNQSFLKKIFHFIFNIQKNV